MQMSYSIQQASEQTGLSVHTLRYYEKIGLILDVARNAAGRRQYSDADLQWIRFLKQLKATGMPLVQMKTFAELRRGGHATHAARRGLLAAHRTAVEAQISALHDCLDLIDYKINKHLQGENADDNTTSNRNVAGE